MSIKHHVVLKEKKRISDWIQEYHIQVNRFIRLDSGLELNSFDVKFRTYGELNSSQSNAIFIFHPLSFGLEGFARADQDKCWWTKIVGPGKCLDTNKYCLILGSITFIAEQVKTLSPKDKELFLTFDDVVRMQKHI
jgi:homoserine acetyltransferase